MDITDTEFKPLERFRIDKDTVVIEMALDEPFDIYDDKDPSPLKMRDFSKSVQEYIIEGVLVIPKNKKIRIDFYFYKFNITQEEILLLEKSYKAFFAYEIRLKHYEMKQKLKQGFRSMLSGLLFLFCCMHISRTFFLSDSTLLSSFAAEGLNVLGWVSLWNPVQVFLYELWPISQKRKLLERSLRAQTKFLDILSLPEERRFIE